MHRSVFVDNTTDRPTERVCKCLLLKNFVNDLLSALPSLLILSFFFFLILFIYLLAVRGLHCCMLVFSSCSEQELLSGCMWELLIVVASLVTNYGLSSCGTQAYLPRGMWNFSGSGIKPVFPALVGGFLTTGSPGKSHFSHSDECVLVCLLVPIATLIDILLMTNTVKLLFTFWCSVTQLCPTLCDPMDYSTPGFPVLYHLPELAQTHVH